MSHTHFRQYYINTSKWNKTVTIIQSLFHWNHSTPCHIKVSWNKRNSIQITLWALVQNILSPANFSHQLCCVWNYLQGCSPWHLHTLTYTLLESQFKPSTYCFILKFLPNFFEDWGPNLLRAWLVLLIMWLLRPVPSERRTHSLNDAQYSIC